jgi:hypothetical protein
MEVHALLECVPLSLIHIAVTQIAIRVSWRWLNADVQISSLGGFRKTIHFRLLCVVNGSVERAWYQRCDNCKTNILWNLMHAM